MAEVGVEPSAASKLEEQAQDDSTLKESINHGGGEAPSAEEDVLSEFWPSPPSTPCSNELQVFYAILLCAIEGEISVVIALYSRSTKPNFISIKSYSYSKNCPRHSVANDW